MMIARLGSLCAIVLLSSSAVLANDECNIGKWNVSFVVDATDLKNDLTAEVTSKTKNVPDLEMPDIAAGSKGWNACFNAVGMRSASVTVSYSTNDGTERYLLQYSWSNSGQAVHVKFQYAEAGLSQPWYTANYDNNPPTVILSGG